MKTVTATTAAIDHVHERIETLLMKNVLTITEKEAVLHAMAQEKREMKATAKTSAASAR
jgi:hypothetical protein